MELFDSRDLQFAVNVHELKQDVDTDMKKLTTSYINKSLRCILVIS